MNRLVKYEIKKVNNKEELRIEYYIADNEETYYKGFHDVVDFYYHKLDRDKTIEENIIESLMWHWNWEKGDNLIIVD